MAEFCDVAVPVPLDLVFTYKVPDEFAVRPGSRVVVPFRQKRVLGIVTELHDREPRVKAKPILEVLDPENAPALNDELLRLGKWISEYYLAPIGDVFRTMLPLSAEFRRVVLCRITDGGHLALHLAGSAGSVGHSKRTPEEQDVEFRVLDFLSARSNVLEPALRSATRASRAILAGMV